MHVVEDEGHAAAQMVHVVRLRFSETKVVRFVRFPALHCADKFLNEQRILGLNLGNLFLQIK